MGFCTGTAAVWKFVGHIVTIFKIVIPILIFIFGAVDLAKAVVASKDDEIKKAAKSLLFRILAGTVIFFIPVLISFAFTLVDGFSGDVETDYNICAECISNPKNCKTS